MSIQLTEPVIDAIVARLGANGTLNATIDTLNSALADENTVPYPEQVLAHLPEPFDLTVFPTIGVGEGPGRFEDDIGSSSTGVYQFTILCFLSQADQAILALKLRRLRTAIARCLLDGRTLPTADGAGTAAWGVALVRLDPGRVLADVVQDTNGRRQVESFMAWCGLTIECKADEDA